MIGKKIVKLEELEAGDGVWLTPNWIIHVDYVDQHGNIHLTNGEVILALEEYAIHAFVMKKTTEVENEENSA